MREIFENRQQWHERSEERKVRGRKAQYARNQRELEPLFLAFKENPCPETENPLVQWVLNRVLKKTLGTFRSILGWECEAAKVHGEDATAEIMESVLKKLQVNGFESFDDVLSYLSRCLKSNDKKAITVSNHIRKAERTTRKAFRPLPQQKGDGTEQFPLAMSPSSRFIVRDSDIARLDRLPKKWLDFVTALRISGWSKETVMEAFGLSSNGFDQRISRLRKEIQNIVVPA